MMKYQVLIVDDEFLARRVLASFVSQCPDLELAGQCANAADAFAAVKVQHIDIVLLDIHMPDLSGLDLARMLKDEAVIFTTAYSQYAIESYSLDAVDYLLKPIAFDRFQQAIDKARRRLGALTPPPAATRDMAAPAPAAERDGQAAGRNGQAAGWNGQPAPTGTEASPSAGSDGFLMVRADYRLHKINFDDLLYIEGQHEYVSFYLGDRRITALYSLKSLEEQLPADRFVRVHKSYIVSLRHISEVRSDAILVAGRRIPVGGIYREGLQQRLGVI